MISLMLSLLKKVPGILQASLPVVILVVVLASGFLNVFQYMRVQSQHENNKLLNEQMLELSTQKQTLEQQILTMQGQQKAIADLDKKYTQELADAQNQISTLERDVRDGKRQLQLNAKCSGGDSHREDATTTASVANAPTARLTPDAEQAYFKLKREFNQITKQVTGLQEYIRQACLVERY